jgi:uncharacterized membrane protein YidH (DUF202 family)
MLLRYLPLLAGILPLTAMFGAFWIGVANDVLPACFPLVDGCVSISATGRKPPGSFLFRAIMLPQALVLTAVWYFSALWLQALDPGARPKTARLMIISGLVGAAALIVYVTFLGTKEPIYEFMRRTGIYFGFLGTAVAQLSLALVLVRVARKTHREKLQQIATVLLMLCAVPFALGILNMILNAVLEDSNATENRIEWIVSLIMQLYFFGLYLAWRSTRFEAAVRVGEGNAR